MDKIKALDAIEKILAGGAKSITILMSDDEKPFKYDSSKHKDKLEDAYLDVYVGTPDPENPTLICSYNK